jgi:hypothetical protein
MELYNPKHLEPAQGIEQRQPARWSRPRRRRFGSQIHRITHRPVRSFNSRKLKANSAAQSMLFALAHRERAPLTFATKFSGEDVC